MSKVTDKALENYMKEHFPFAQFKKAGFFKPELKGNYEAQAKQVCKFFGYESVYEYSKHEIRCHLSLINTEPLMDVNGSGELGVNPFVTTIFPNQLHI